MTFARGDTDADREDADADRAAVAQASTALLNAVNASDVAGVLAGWSDDGVLMPPHHPSVHGRSNIEEYFRGRFSQSRFAFSFTSSRIEIAGDVALLRRGARVDAIDKTWGTPPLIWALTGWRRKPATEAGRYHEVVARLVAAGANVKPDLLDWDKARADPKMLAALTGKIKAE